MSGALRARDLVELAALVADHAHTIVSHHGPAVASQLDAYWIASKRRLDLWAAELKAHNGADDSQARRAAERFRPRHLVEEIVASEVLTRVWTAILSTVDHRAGSSELAPVGRSVFVGHLEARHRALQLLLHGIRIPLSEAASINRLRGRVDRWTDLLVGRIVRLGPVLDLAADSERCQRLASELARQEATGDHQAWPNVLAALRVAFRQLPQFATPHAEANGAIAASVLACLHGAAFDGVGLLRSDWLSRLEVAPCDTKVLIDRYLGLEETPSRRTPRTFPPLGQPPRRLDF